MTDEWRNGRNVLRSDGATPFRSGSHPALSGTLRVHPPVPAAGGLRQQVRYVRRAEECGEGMYGMSGNMYGMNGKWTELAHRVGCARLRRPA